MRGEVRVEEAFVIRTRVEFEADGASGAVVFETTMTGAWARRNRRELAAEVARGVGAALAEGEALERLEEVVELALAPVPDKDPVRVSLSLGDPSGREIRREAVEALEEADAPAEAAAVERFVRVYMKARDPEGVSHGALYEAWSNTAEATTYPIGERRFSKLVCLLYDREGDSPPILGRANPDGGPTVLYWAGEEGDWERKPDAPGAGYFPTRALRGRRRGPAGGKA